jgi:hypothetical protein
VPLLAFLGATRAFGRRAGAAALVLTALDPVLVDHARMARPYPLAEAAALLAFLGVARSLETGAWRDRLLAYGGAVLAVYAHFLFLAVLPAVFLGSLAAGRARRREVARDALVAVVALVPALGQMLSLYFRRADLAWVQERSLAPLASLAPVTSIVALLAGLPFLAKRRAWVFPAASLGLTLLGIFTLRALGSNILVGRYLALGVVSAALLVAWAIGSLPRAVGAGALALAAIVPVPLDGLILDPRAALASSLVREARPQGWRDAALCLDGLEPAPGEPVLLWSLFIEGNLLARPGGATAERRSFLSSPLDDRPGGSPPRHPLLLTAQWGVPGQADYFEGEIAPRLERASRFFLIADPRYERRFEGWLARRFSGRFHCAFRSPELGGPLFVTRWEAG